MRAMWTCLDRNSDDIGRATLAAHPAVSCVVDDTCGHARRTLGRSENGLDALICLADGLHIDDAKIERGRCEGVGLKRVVANIDKEAKLNRN